MAVYTTISRTDAQELFKSLGEIVKLEGIKEGVENTNYFCLLYTSPSPRDRTRSRMPSSA